MRKQLLFLGLVLFVSCRDLEKVPDENTLLEQELKAINWNEVDEYPSIAECEKLSDKKQRKQCFFEFMSVAVQEKLGDENLKLDTKNQDTLLVKVIVNADASLEFEPQFPADSVAYNAVKIDSILKSKLTDFPTVKPALKRGIPVRTTFVLPVVLED